MQSKSTHRARSVVAGTCCAALLACAPAVSLAADPPDRAELERELQEARQELDEAAREVADLSRQLYGAGTGEAMRVVHGGPSGSMLGVNINGATARDEGVEVMGVSPGGPAAAGWAQGGRRAGRSGRPGTAAQ